MQSQARVILNWGRHALCHNGCQTSIVKRTPSWGRVHRLRLPCSLLLPLGGLVALAPSSRWSRSSRTSCSFRSPLNFEDKALPLKWLATVLIDDLHLILQIPFVLWVGHPLEPRKIAHGCEGLAQGPRPPTTRAVIAMKTFMQNNAMQLTNTNLSLGGYTAFTACATFIGDTA